jgi:hypothetical protein
MNRTRTTRTLAGGLAIATLAATPAAAMPVDALHGPATAPEPTRVVLTAPPAGGFDWASAGIGAAGGLALIALSVGGFAVSQRTRIPVSR